MAPLLLGRGPRDGGSLPAGPFLSPCPRGGTRRESPARARLPGWPERPPPGSPAVGGPPGIVSALLLLPCPAPAAPARQAALEKQALRNPTYQCEQQSQAQPSAGSRPLPRPRCRRRCHLRAPAWASAPAPQPPGELPQAPPPWLLQAGTAGTPPGGSAQPEHGRQDRTLVSVPPAPSPRHQRSLSRPGSSQPRFSALPRQRATRQAAVTGAHRPAEPPPSPPLSLAGPAGTRPGHCPALSTPTARLLPHPGLAAGWSSLHPLPERQLCKGSKPGREGAGLGCQAGGGRPREAPAKPVSSPASAAPGAHAEREALGGGSALSDAARGAQKDKAAPRGKRLFCFPGQECQARPSGLSAPQSWGALAPGAQNYLPFMKPSSTRSLRSESQ